VIFFDSHCIFRKFLDHHYLLTVSRLHIEEEYRAHKRLMIPVQTMEVVRSRRGFMSYVLWILDEGNYANSVC